MPSSNPRSESYEFEKAASEQSFQYNIRTLLQCLRGGRLQCLRMISIGLVWPKLNTNSRCLALLTCVNPHVRLRCPESSRSELHWRSRGSEKVWRCDAVLNTNRYQKGMHQDDISTDLALCHLQIVWRGFADSPTISKNRAILRPEKAGAVTDVQSQDQSIQRCCGGVGGVQ